VNTYAVTFVVRGTGTVQTLRVTCDTPADVRQAVATAIMRPTLLVDVLDIQRIP
jgi:hypothetical protein